MVVGKVLNTLVFVLGLFLGGWAMVPVALPTGHGPRARQWVSGYCWGCSLCLLLLGTSILGRSRQREQPFDFVVLLCFCFFVFLGWVGKKALGALHTGHGPRASSRRLGVCWLVVLFCILGWVGVSCGVLGVSWKLWVSIDIPGLPRHPRTPHERVSMGFFSHFFFLAHHLEVGFTSRWVSVGGIIPLKLRTSKFNIVPTT